MSKTMTAPNRRVKRAVTAAIFAVFLAFGATIATPTAANAVVSGGGYFYFISHVQGYGWVDAAGSYAQSLRLEAVKIEQAGSKSLCANAHLAGTGWQGTRCTKPGVPITIGTVGQSRAIEAIRFYVSGCQVHALVNIQNRGFSTHGWANTLTVGTTGQNLRLEYFHFDVKC